MDTGACRAPHVGQCDLDERARAIFGDRVLIPGASFELLKERGNRPEAAALLKEFGYRGWLCCTGLYSDRNARRCRHDMFALEAGTMQDHNVLALPALVPPPPFLSEAEEIT